MNSAQNTANRPPHYVALFSVLLCINFNQIVLVLTKIVSDFSKSSIQMHMCNAAVNCVYWFTHETKNHFYVGYNYEMRENESNVLGLKTKWAKLMLIYKGEWNGGRGKIVHSILERCKSGISKITTRSYLTYPKYERSLK